MDFDVVFILQACDGSVARRENLALRVWNVAGCGCLQDSVLDVSVNRFFGGGDNS